MRQKAAGCWQFGPQFPAQGGTHSNVERLSQSLWVTTEIASFSTHRERMPREVFLKLQDAARLVRTWGDGYGYLLVATGRAEVMVDPAMNLWDAAPLQTVIEEAGGTYTD